MGYVIDTTLGEEKRSARIRFVGESPYRSEEDPRELRMTGPELQARVRTEAKRRGSLTWWFRLVSCGLVRRHVFVDFEVASTGVHFVLCARCFKVARTYETKAIAVSE